MTAGSSTDHYTLALGSANLDDGQLLLKTLEHQLKKPSIIPANSFFPFRRTADRTTVLSVPMEIVDSSIAGISGSYFQWTAPPTPLIRKLFQPFNKLSFN